VVSRLGDVYVYNGSMLQKGDCMLLLVHLGNVAQKEGIGTEDLRFLLENGLPLPTRVTKRLQIEHFEMWLKEEKQREDWDEALRANGNRHAKARHAMRSKYAASLHKRYGKKLWYDVLCKYQTIPERVIELVNENTAKKIAGERAMTTMPLARSLESLALQMPKAERLKIRAECLDANVPFLDGSGPGAERQSRMVQQYEGEGRDTKHEREQAWLVTKQLARNYGKYRVGWVVIKALAHAQNKLWLLRRATVHGISLLE
jgi:hypothetical protein